jgi:hypothetical protein
VTVTINEEFELGNEVVACMSVFAGELVRLLEQLAIVKSEVVREGERSGLF